MVRRASTSIDGRGVARGRGYGSTSGTRNAVAMRMIRGRPVDGELAQRLAGLGREHQREVLVGAQLAGRRDDGAHEQVLERVGALDLGAQDGEEVLELADPQRLEQHVLAAGEQPVDRRPRHARFGGDVVDRDLGDAPPLAAPFVASSTRSSSRADIRRRQ